MKLEFRGEMQTGDINLGIVSIQMCKVIKLDEATKRLSVNRKRSSLKTVLWGSPVLSSKGAEEKPSKELIVIGLASAF